MEKCIYYVLKVCEADCSVSVVPDSVSLDFFETEELFHVLQKDPFNIDYDFYLESKIL